MFTDRENISFSTIKTYFYPLHFQNQLFTILGDQECKHPTSLVDRCMDDTQIGFKFAQCRPSEPVDSRGKEKCLHNFKYLHIIIDVLFNSCL